MISSLAFAIVVLLALYFLAIGMAALFAPAKASRFLLGFAASARAHYAEMLARFIAGAALLVQAPRMLHPEVFRGFGWLLVITTALLLLLPWRRHRRFAAWSVPQALRYLGAIGVCSLALGSLLMVALLRGSTR